MPRVIWREICPLIQVHKQRYVFPPRHQQPKGSQYAAAAACTAKYPTQQVPGGVFTQGRQNSAVRGLLTVCVVSTSKVQFKHKLPGLKKQGNLVPKPSSVRENLRSSETFGVASSSASLSSRETTKLLLHRSWSCWFLRLWLVREPTKPRRMICRVSVRTHKLLQRKVSSLFSVCTAHIQKPSQHKIS